MFQRLLILCRINRIKTAVYFPNDGVDKNKIDLLFYELLENCSVFQSHGYETCLTGDFNGKSLRQCEFTGKSLFCKDNQSYNGIRLLQFSEASELDIVNTFNCCDGFYTRILNDQLMLAPF
jgi:hypothetical protein